MSYIEKIFYWILKKKSEILWNKEDSHHWFNPVIPNSLDTFLKLTTKLQLITLNCSYTIFSWCYHSTRRMGVRIYMPLVSVPTFHGGKCGCDSWEGTRTERRGKKTYHWYEFLYHPINSLHRSMRKCLLILNTIRCFVLQYIPSVFRFKSCGWLTEQFHQMFTVHLI